MQIRLREELLSPLTDGAVSNCLNILIIEDKKFRLLKLIGKNHQLIAIDLKTFQGRREDEIYLKESDVIGTTYFSEIESLIEIVK